MGSRRDFPSRSSTENWRTRLPERRLSREVRWRRRRYIVAGDCGRGTCATRRWNRSLMRRAYVALMRTYRDVRGGGPSDTLFAGDAGWQEARRLVSYRAWFRVRCRGDGYPGEPGRRGV